MRKPTRKYLNLFDLWRNHGQHFSFYAIELIKTSPSSTLDESWEDRTHGLQAQTLESIRSAEGPNNCMQKFYI